MSVFKRDVMFDLECFQDYFVCYLDNRRFRIEDIEKLKLAMSRDDTLYVGYNIISYDTIILGFAFWLDAREVLEPWRLKALSDWMIAEKPSEDRYVQRFMSDFVDKYSITHKKETRTFHKLKREALWAKVTFGDLYLIGNKSGGLKKAAVVLDSPDLSECPIHWDVATTNENDRAIIDSYCAHDVMVTRLAWEYYEKSFAIGVRDIFYTEQGITDAYCLGAAALSEKYFKSRGIAEGGEEFVAILEKHKEWALEPTPQCRTIRLIKCGPLKFKDKFFAEFQKKIRASYFDIDGAKVEDEEEESKGGDTTPTPFVLDEVRLLRRDLVVEDHKGHKYQFGAGGLHDDSDAGLWQERPGKILRNVDVKSYYPSLIVAWALNPRHFKAYKGYIEEALATRLAAKKDPKLKGKAESLKLAMNSSFGKMKDKFCSLFDPFAHFGVTITGQMGLLYLIDKIYEACPEAEVINANTDGVCVMIDDTSEKAMEAACAEWEEVMKVSLEFDKFVKWAQLSCNLYCALTDTGKVKSKGVMFKLEPSSLGEGHKIARATKQMVIQHLLFDKDLREVALSMEPKMFLLSASCGAKTRFVHGGKLLEGRTSIRYVFSNGIGAPLCMRNVKTGKDNKVKDGARVVMADVLADLKMEDIDIGRYVDMARETIDEIRKADSKRNVLRTGFFSLL